MIHPLFAAILAPVTPPEEKPVFPKEWHDHRDQGDPMIKRDVGSASDWENRPEYDEWVRL